MDDLDMIMASLENGIGSIGGFAAGTSFVVEHQTLAGLGNTVIKGVKCLGKHFNVFKWWSI